MRRREEEKRRKFHEALLQTLYPPPSSPSSPSSSSPSPAEIVDEEPFDVTLINPEDYVNIGSSNHDDDNENGDDSGTSEKMSRAQRKRLRKKMLKEEAIRRKTIIGPLLPITDHEEEKEENESCLQPVRRNAQEKEDDAGESNIEEEEEESCLQHVRRNAQEKEEEKLSDNDKTRKVKKRREAKKLAKESSKPVLNQLVEVDILTESKPVSMHNPLG